MAPEIPDTWEQTADIGRTKVGTGGSPASKGEGGMSDTPEITHEEALEWISDYFGEFEPMPDQEREISTDICEKAREVASRLDNIFFDSRSISWIDDARRIVEAALAQERERAARIADEMAMTFGNGRPATTVYGQAWQASCAAIATAIRDHSGREK